MEEDDNAAIGLSFADFFENSKYKPHEELPSHLPGEMVDGGGSESDVVSKPNNPQPHLNEPTNEGLLTPGQIRARKEAIAMLSNFSWADELSNNSD